MPLVAFPDPRLTSFGYVLWQLSHVTQQRMTASLAALNLTLPQLGALVHLARADASSTADLARMTLTTPQNMSLTVTKLEDAGYVVRRPHDTHGRIHVLAITPEGVRALRRAIVRVSKIEDEMLRGIPPAERARLTAALGGCLKNLQAEKKQGAT